LSKVVKIRFSMRNKENNLFCWHFKNQGGPWSPFPPRPCAHGWSDLSIKCSECFPELWGKSSYCHWRYPRCVSLSKVSSKYCACVINTAHAW